MIKLETFLFYVGISILLLCVLLTFIFFNPKQISEEENLVFMNSLTPKQIQLLVLNSIEEGDLILMKPKSFSDSYIYDQKIDKGFRNRYTAFFWNSFFDKIIISSMGDTYWHIGIYVGDQTMNSLGLDIYENKLNENFFQHHYFKILNVKTSNTNKKLAIERSKQHLKDQDIFYSLKNGLIAVFLESTKSDKEYNLREDELICSSYIALIYKEVIFNDKYFTHLTPVALEFSNKNEIKFLANETGFYRK